MEKYRDASLEKLVNGSLEFFQDQVPCFLHDDQILHLYELSSRFFPDFARNSQDIKDCYMFRSGYNEYEWDKSYNLMRIRYGPYRKQVNRIKDQSKAKESIFGEIK
ncbi:MAG: hypothetical protein LBI29_02830 [Rickettsiales bacterium]|jgi:hypothetical protein|nr:hypothetical protein [Rickettsiales bacterium]